MFLLAQSDRALVLYLHQIQQSETRSQTAVYHYSGWISRNKLYNEDSAHTHVVGGLKLKCAYANFGIIDFVYAI